MSWPATGARRLSASRLARAMLEALVAAMRSRRAAGRAGSTAAARRSPGCAAQHRGAAAAGSDSRRGVSPNVLAGDEAALRRAALAAHIGGAPCRRRARPRSRARSLASRVWASASSWLRMIVDLLRRPRSGGRAVEAGARRWTAPRAAGPAATIGAVLDQHLLDPAALDRVEIDGEQRRDAGAQAAGNRRTCRCVTVEMVSRDRPATVCAVGARREPPEQRRAASSRPRAPSADLDAWRQAASFDDAVHAAAACGGSPFVGLHA